MEHIRQEVSLGCRVLGLAGQGDFVLGHVSFRDPEGRGVWLKASGWGFEEMAPDRVHLVGWDGEVLEGSGSRHIEYPIHTEIMRARTDVNCVVHTHAPYSVIFASLDVPLRAISHEGTLFTPPDIPRFTLTGDLIMTRELGVALADALGDRNAMLMVRHGIVTVGPDVPTAVMTAIILETACQKQLAAMASGTIVHYSDDAEALAKREHCFGPRTLRQMWNYMVRKLGGF